MTEYYLNGKPLLQGVDLTGDQSLPSTCEFHLHRAGQHCDEPAARWVGFLAYCTAHAADVTELEKQRRINTRGIDS